MQRNQRGQSVLFGRLQCSGYRWLTPNTTRHIKHRAHGETSKFRLVLCNVFWLAYATHHPEATCRLLCVPEAHTFARPLCRKTSLRSEGYGGNAAASANAGWMADLVWETCEEVEDGPALYCAMYVVRCLVWGVVNATEQHEDGLYEKWLTPRKRPRVHLKSLIWYFFSPRSLNRMSFLLMGLI